MNPGQTSHDSRQLARAVPLLMVVAACVFNAIAYTTELRELAPDVNDDVFHFGLIQHMNAAWDAGSNPLDTWIGYWGQGFPVLRYYQHLPHFVVVLVYRLLGGTVPLHAVFDGASLALLVLLPLSFYCGTLALGATRMTAACITLCTPLLGADPSQHHYLGFQPQSFVWSGGGLFTQLAAMVLFPLALGATSKAALAGRRFAPAIALLSATWLSHLVLGYIACLLSLVVLLRPESAGRRMAVALRLGAVFAGVAIVAAYLLLPTVLESRWLARSVLEPAEYWDSYGARHVLTALVTGGLLDGNRIPVLTILAGLGALLTGASLVQHRHGRADGFASAALGMFALALMLYFGRPTWGRLLELLPFSGSLPLHRFICAVQFGGVLLAGYALSRIAELLLWSSNGYRATVAALLAMAILAPAIMSTVAFARKNSNWRQAAETAFATRGRPVEEAVADFKAADAAVPGRGYAGASWDWGREFKIGDVNVYHRWSAHDLPAISYMYHTMGPLSDLEPGFNPARRDHFELFNVRHVLADDMLRLPVFATRKDRTAPGVVAGTVDTEGYFGIVGSAAYFSDVRHDARALRALNAAFIASHWHAKDQFVRIGWRAGDRASPDELPLSSVNALDFNRSNARKPPRGTILSSGGNGDRYEAKVRLDEPGVILFRMTYHPHWQAELDGVPVDTMLLAPGYLGVRAPSGDHVLALRYRPPRWNALLLAAGLGVLLLVIVTDVRRRRALSRVATS
jgi:hypothetical protein